jgi:hypothetical protein
MAESRIAAVGAELVAARLGEAHQPWSAFRRDGLVPRRPLDGR